MTEYLKKSFTVGMSVGQKYRDNWDAIFTKKADTKDVLDVNVEKHLNWLETGEGEPWPEKPTP